MRVSSGLATLLACVLLAFVPAASAHHSPSDVIDALSQRIAKGERSASIFVRRGDEYRSIGNNRAAIADYDSALQLKADDFPAMYGMAQAHFSLLQWAEAQAVAESGIASAKNRNNAAPFQAILARTHEQNDHWELALESWQQTLASSRPKVDWFLGESHSLKRLNRINDAKQALEAAMKRNPSAVLRREWIEVLIDCHEIEEAEKHISAGLSRTRWKSSWLLLRARLYLAQNQTDAAHQDARDALREIDSRLNPDFINPFLSADRGRALLILGYEDEACDEASGNLE